ncbi:MAG: hypothetical protein ACR2RF_29245 [Geminicoccaceae bacterium]
MNDKNASFSDRPSLDDRQAAERKLCRLFKSFGVNALVVRDRLIDPFLDRATTLWRPHVGIDFATLAVREAEADLESWFTTLLGEVLEGRAGAMMIGRAAFLMCDGPAQFADQLLLPVESLPAAFVSAMGDHVPSAVPPSEMGEMHHQPYEAWSPSTMVARALPMERGFFQGLAGLVRRNEGSTSFSWRGIGRTS